VRKEGRFITFAEEVSFMKAGFIGIGHLGRAMAGRLRDEGVELVLWNRTRRKALDLGVPVAESPAEVFASADLAFMNLFDSDAVRSVLTGENGFAGCPEKKGKVVVDTTTNHFRDVLDFHRILREQGAFYVESPVAGSVVPASRGTLTVMASGEEAAFERARPYLELIGKNVFYLREAGRATRMKLINNLVLGVLMGGIAEAASLAEEAGIPKEEALDILAAGAGNSAVMNAKKDKLLKEDFSCHFSGALMYKDLHYLQDLAREVGMPLFTGSAVKEVFALGFPQGLGGEDFSAVYRALRGLKREG
jgi:3-hydroxyisobutyrate dehydrogenase